MSSRPSPARRRSQVSCTRNLSVTVLAALSAALSAALPAPALAELSERVVGTAGWQYDSNVYDLQSGFPVPGTNDYRRADSYYSYAGELDLNETYSLQNWFATGAFTRYVYDHFGQLTHNEYRLDGGWNWKLGDIWDGRLEVTRTRTMVAFTEIVQLELAVVTEQRESALVGVQIMPEWRLEASAFTHKLDEPLLEEPNLQLNESTGSLALKYGGTAALTSGLTTSYSHGSYTGATIFVSPAYNQEVVALTATYQPPAPSGSAAGGNGAGGGGASTFDGAVGWSQRSSRFNVDNASGLIGHLDYRNQLTLKTSVQLAIDRQIQSYLTNGASELDTSVGVNASWQATPFISISPAYTWLYRFLPDQGLIAGTDRTDHLQFASLTANYQARPWITIKPYVNIQTRRSNLYGGNFNATVFGIAVSLAAQHPTAGS